MGKRLIQQRRGRGKGKFKAPSHNYIGEIKYIHEKEIKGVVEEILHDPGHTSPVARIRLENNKKILFLASEGMQVGQEIRFTERKECEIGNVLPIGKIPEGYPVYNIELMPGDGGKLVRAGGSYATVVSHDAKKTVIQLPSGQFKTLDSSCRATVGVSAGGGRKDKPFVKAGKKFFAFRARGKQYPIVRGVAMNPVAHPHGGGSHQHIGKPSTVKRGAPPGRKVGSIAADRSGRK
ncbi:MAG: 50S ribosomal protein L2 [Thermoplasmata archaeon]|nr:MAG: 50S ribosomal protein L2 [Thermoplasmata archaeon]